MYIAVSFNTPIAFRRYLNLISVPHVNRFELPLSLRGFIQIHLPCLAYVYL